MDQGEETFGTAATEYAVRIAAGIGAFTREEWDSFGGTTKTSTSGYNPFLSFDFLSALEDSGCAVRQTGWQGHHLRLETGGGRLLGALPCYAKSHSQGEYVFDHGWADAFERAGGNYYPKLQCSVPFTPVTGPRLLVRQGEDEATVKAGLAAALKTVTDR
ncbi:MAG: N-acetyltransferase, partial [Mesorhizobium sp.]|nr:N-acetyltransferase [Mesorhizobium sp.]